MARGRGTFVDITNKKFNHLIALKEVKRPKNASGTGAWWLVRCDCGKEKIMRANSLRTKNTKSCGCLTSKLMSESRKLEKGLSQKRTVYRYYERHAEKLKKKFELSFNYFGIITQQNCYYCGAKPSNIQKTHNDNGDFVYNGIDRKNNNLGYTKRNCVPCCKICNIAKNKQTKREFYNWVKKVWDRIKLGRR